MAFHRLEFLTTVKRLNAVMSVLQSEKTVRSNSKGMQLFELPVQVALMG